jgi:transposase-like protein
MKTIKITASPSLHVAPVGTPEGAHRATSGVPTGGGGDAAAPPDPQVIPQKPRRRLSAQYKLRILAEADRCTDVGQIARLLRREGLYSSSLTRWRRLRDQGLLDAMAPKTRGRKPLEKNPLADELAALQKQNQILSKKLWQAERIIEVQKKISLILKAGNDLIDLNSDNEQKK